jgi:hypothetical protein
LAAQSAIPGNYSMCICLVSDRLALYLFLFVCLNNSAAIELGFTTKVTKVTKGFVTGKRIRVLRVLRENPWQTYADLD